MRPLEKASKPEIGMAFDTSGGKCPLTKQPTTHGANYHFKSQLARRGSANWRHSPGAAIYLTANQNPACILATSGRFLPKVDSSPTSGL
jgi:hypothetical protein